MPTAPKWFKVVALLALLWNLLGAAAYLGDVMMSPEAIAALPDAQRAMYESRPGWFVTAYAVAVWFGVVGSLGLVLRKRWANGPLLASLLGLVVQDVGLLRMPAAREPAVLGLQGTVLVIAVLLVWLARRATREQWIA